MWWRLEWQLLMSQYVIKLVNFNWNRGQQGNCYSFSIIVFVLYNLQFGNKLSFTNQYKHMAWYGTLSDYGIISTLNSSFYSNRNFDLKHASISEHSRTHCPVLIIYPVIRHFLFTWWMTAPYVLFFLLPLGFEEISTYAIYGTGAFFAGWILSAVVSALDSIPLVSSYRVLHTHTTFCMIKVLVTDCGHVCSSQKFWKS